MSFPELKKKKKISSFLELSIQGMSQEERYVMKVIIIDAPVQVHILNGIWEEFLEYLSFDYGENVCVVKITQRKCAPNSAGVKYFHLLPGFSEDLILGYKFNGTSPPLITLPELGVYPVYRNKNRTYFNDIWTKR